MVLLIPVGIPPCAPGSLELLYIRRTQAREERTQLVTRNKACPGWSWETLRVQWSRWEQTANQRHSPSLVFFPFLSRLLLEPAAKQTLLSPVGRAVATGGVGFRSLGTGGGCGPALASTASLPQNCLSSPTLASGCTGRPLGSESSHFSLVVDAPSIPPQ